jgi:hypothetical protein
LEAELSVDQFEDLPERAEKVLGYSLAKSRKKSATLRNALAELKLKPFSAESVARYEKAALAERGATFWARHPRLYDACEAVGISAWLTGTIVGALFSTLATAEWLLGFGHLQSLLCTLASCSLGAFAGLAYSIGLHVWGKKSKKAASWVDFELCSYGSPVPHFALETAVQVKEAMPEARITVRSLIQDSAELDPFLVASSGSESYYLEVWREPHFDAKREA